MRAGLRLLLTGCACVLSLGLAAGQEAAPCTPGVNIAGITLGPERQKGSSTPFVATVKSSFEHRLIDGNVISGQEVTHVAQNTEGWTRQEIGGVCKWDAEGKPKLDRIVTVTKGKGESLRWTESDTGRQEATLSRPVEPRLDPKPEPRALPVARPTPLTRTVNADVARYREQTKTEALGTATVAGFVATGSRTIRTYPPGNEGNSMPLVITTEYWRTADGWLVKWANDDPRRGKSTAEIETLESGEPAASWFQPPPGYTIREVSRAAPVVAAGAAALVR